MVIVLRGRGYMDRCTKFLITVLDQVNAASPSSAQCYCVPSFLQVRF